MTTLKEALDQLAKGHELDNEQKKLIIDKWQKELGVQSCDDCISRADVEQTVEDNILCYTHSDRLIDQDPDTECHKAIRTALKMLRKDLRKLPPVTPRQRTGHWIGRKRIGFGKWEEYIVSLKDGFVKDSCSCSECGEWLTGSDEYQCSGNYCPNCGARMIELQETGQEARNE